MNFRSAVGRFLAVTVFILSAVLVAGIAASCTLIGNSSFNLQRQSAWLGPEPVPLRSGWQYRWGDDVTWAREPNSSTGWSDFAYPGAVPGREGRDSLWLSFVLPDQKMEDPTLFFLAVDSHFEVWIDGKMQFSFGDVQGPGREKFLGYPWFLVPLPERFQGKKVFLRVHSTHDNIGPFGEVLLGSRAAHLARLVRNDFPKFAIGAVIFIAGICGLFLYFRRRKEYIYLGFSLVCLSLGSYLVCRTALKQLFLHAPVFWFVVEVVSFFLMPLSIATFTDAVFGKNLLTWFARVASVYAVFALFGVMFGHWSLLETLMPFQVFFLFCIVAFSWELLKRLGKEDVDPKIMAAGFFILVLSGVHDLLRAMGLLHSTIELSYWGVLGVLGSMSAITVRRFTEVYVRMEVTSRSLALKSADLEQRNADLVAMSEELGRVAVRLGDRLNTPLEVMLLASEEIEDHVEEHFKGVQDEGLRHEIAHLFEVFRHSTSTIRTELKSLQPFKKYAPQDAAECDVSVSAFEARTSLPPKINSQ